MKFVALALAATVAVVAAAETPVCDTKTLLPLIQTTGAKKCQEDSGYSVITRVVPTDDQMKKVCTLPECKALLAELNKAIPTDCDLLGTKARSALLEPINKACAGSGGAATTTPAPGGANTTAPATGGSTAGSTAGPTITQPAVTETPATTTDAPKGSMGGSAAGSSGDAVKEPSTTTAAPKTTVPAKSGAATLATAAGAVVVASVAALL